MSLTTNARHILSYAKKAFSNKLQVDLLHQELALNFYPERATFTTERIEGSEYSGHLFTSAPVIARRELGNLLAASLRPRSQRWLSVHIKNDEDLDKEYEVRQFLERLDKIQWSFMYNTHSQFVNATKLADHDYATFGNAVIQVRINGDWRGLLFTNHHLKDCAWSTNMQGVVDCMYRKWKPTAKQLFQMFPQTASKDVRKALVDDPEKTFECMHIVLPSRLYTQKDKESSKFPFTSFYVECESETVLEEVPMKRFEYIVPRWLRIGNYGMSMATCVVLPDGRTLQVVTRTLMEAAEKHVDPPLIATHNVIRGDISTYAGGITYVDQDYDEKLGEALRPLARDKSGMPIGQDIAIALKEDIHRGFFLDRIQLPETNKDMTAFEVRQRVSEHIRSASPIFEPIEDEYNNPLCELIFDTLMDAGAFPIHDMPDIMSEQELKFSFRSPLADMADQAEAETYLDVLQRVVMPAASVDPAQIKHVNFTKATRDAMRASGWKAEWFNEEEAVAQEQQRLAEEQQMMKMMQMAQSAGMTAEQGGKGLGAIAGAMGGAAGAQAK